MQLYAGIRVGQHQAPSAYAKRVAQRLQRDAPDAVTAVMAEARRVGRVHGRYWRRSSDVRSV
ncbi:MAG TPA: hypothetical protein VGM75_03590 [Pseudonocardiaceae bacterium]